MNPRSSVVLPGVVVLSLFCVGQVQAECNAEGLRATALIMEPPTIDGDLAGHNYTLTRHAGSHDYYAQFGTCMNDKNCAQGLSTWLKATDIKTGETYRGDINVTVSAPIPEPSAALVFGLGTLLTSSAIRRRRD